jgi:hypothetical protein
VTVSTRPTLQPPAWEVERALVEVAVTLTHEHPEVPAGTVLRRLARAVRRARGWGCPEQHLPRTAEAVTRWALTEN